MLAMPDPTLTRYEDGQGKADFGEKDLVFEHTPKAVLESTHMVYDLTPQQNIRRGRGNGFSRQEEGEQRWRLHKRIGRNTNCLQAVALEILGIPRPTVPQLRGSVDHAGLGVGVQNRYLLLQFLRQPHIVSVQKPN